MGLRELEDVDFPEAEHIRLVQDNLNTHIPGSLYEAFPAPEARRILSGWNCTTRPTRELAQHGRDRDRGIQGPVPGPPHRHARTRSSEESPLGAERNAAGARVKWMFTTEQARVKMGRAYPKPTATLKQPAKES